MQKTKKHIGKYVNIAPVFIPRWHIIKIVTAWDKERMEKQEALIPEQRDVKLMSYLRSQIFQKKQELALCNYLFN